VVPLFGPHQKHLQFTLLANAGGRQVDDYRKKSLKRRKNDPLRSYYRAYTAFAIDRIGGAGEPPPAWMRQKTQPTTLSQLAFVLFFLTLSLEPLAFQLHGSKLDKVTPGAPFGGKGMHARVFPRVSSPGLRSTLFTRSWGLLGGCHRTGPGER
jgi:hypothetical protein